MFLSSAAVQDNTAVIDRSAVVDMTVAVSVKSCLVKSSWFTPFGFTS